MGDSVSVTVIATGFGANVVKTTHTVTEQQLMNAGLSRLSQEMHNQTYESISLSTTSMEMTPSAMAEAEAPMAAMPEMPMPQPVQQFHTQPQAQPHMANPQPQSNASLPRNALPRDVLLAKARAYRESQVSRDHSQPEQLSMNMDDAMPSRLMPEPAARAPFDSENLEVPSYLRRKRGVGVEAPE